MSDVDVPAIQRIVQQAFSAPQGAGLTKSAGPAKGSTPAKGGTSSATKAPARPAPTALPAAKVTVDVINNGAPTGSASSGSASGTSGAAPALTPQEKQWAAEAKAKYGIPCVY